MNKIKWGVGLLCIMAVFAMIGCENAAGGTDTPAEGAVSENFLNSLKGKSGTFALVGGQQLAFSDNGKVVTLTIMGIKITCTFLEMESESTSRAYYTTKLAAGTDYYGVELLDASAGTGNIYLGQGAMPGAGGVVTPKDKVFAGTAAGGLTPYAFTVTK